MTTERSTVLGTAGTDQPRKRPPNAGKGRKPGVPNRVTRALKEAILHAFDTLGGVEYLVIVGQSDPRTFCALLAKILPTEIRADTSDDLANAIYEARQRAARSDEDRPSITAEGERPVAPTTPAEAMVPLEPRLRRRGRRRR